MSQYHTYFPLVLLSDVQNFKLLFTVILVLILLLLMYRLIKNYTILICTTITKSKISLTDKSDALKHANQTYTCADSLHSHNIDIERNCLPKTTSIHLY